MSASTRYVPLASVARPHGVTGELKLKLFNEETTMLVKNQRVRLRFPDGRTEDTSLSAVRRVNKGLLVRLTGVDDRNAAEQMRGVDICVRRDALPEVEEGEFYAFDIEGASAETVDGTRIGTVRKLESYPTCDVLIIDVEGAPSVEVPLTEDYIAAIDVEAHRIVVRTLDGLR